MILYGGDSEKKDGACFFVGVKERKEIYIVYQKKENNNNN